MSIQNQTRVVFDADAIAKKGARIVTIHVGELEEEPPIETKAELETRVIEAFRWAYNEEPDHIRARSRRRTVEVRGD